MVLSPILETRAAASVATTAWYLPVADVLHNRERAPTTLKPEGVRSAREDMGN